MVIKLHERCKEMLITQLHILAPNMHSTDLDEMIELIENIKKERTSYPDISTPVFPQWRATQVKEEDHRKEALAREEEHRMDLIQQAEDYMREKRARAEEDMRADIAKAQTKQEIADEKMFEAIARLADKKGGK